MSDRVWLTGPPFTGVLWAGVQARAGGEVWELLPDGEGGLQAVGVRLAGRIRGDTVLVAHGLAIPAALVACNLRQPAGLVLSNGPLRAWNMPRVPSWALHPQVSLRYLASSLGLRRIAVNPYVMDRTTVDTICGPLFQNPARRRALARYLDDLRTWDWSLPFPAHTRLVWGDDDALFPMKEADYLDARLGGSKLTRIPGGRFAHPEERPWAIADAVVGM